MNYYKFKFNPGDRVLIAADEDDVPDDTEIEDWPDIKGSIERIEIFNPGEFVYIISTEKGERMMDDEDDIKHDTL